MKEKYPKWKAQVQLPNVGAFIDVSSADEAERLKELNKDTYITMSLEDAFEYQKKHYKVFFVETDKTKHDSILPDEIRDYIIDNQNIDESLPY